MTVDTTTQPVRSAYPAPVEALLPRARELAEALGSVPSRNRLMQELRIGAPKAAALRELLADRPEPAGRLRVVEADERETPVPAEPEPDSTLTTEDAEPSASVLPTDDGHPDTADDRPIVDEVPPAPSASSAPRAWPVLFLALPAFVAIWSGWVGLGSMTGFGIVRPLPGIWDGFELNTAITLPIGVEVYAAFALRAWLSPGVPARARWFARVSAIGALLIGALGQVAYHLMAAAGVVDAPWPITTLVACLPVAVLGMGAALAHLLHER